MFDFLFDVKKSAKLQHNSSIIDVIVASFLLLIINIDYIALKEQLDPYFLNDDMYGIIIIVSLIIGIIYFRLFTKTFKIFNILDVIIILMFILLSLLIAKDCLNQMLILESKYAFFISTLVIPIWGSIKTISLLIYNIFKI